MTNKNEIERIQRIRDAQIDSRKPRKVRRMNYVVAKEKKRRKAGFAGWVQSFSPPMVGAAMGMVIGFVITLLLRLSLPTQWSLLAVPALLICMVVGSILGKSTEHKYD
jgi:hypothetical protein